MDFWIFNLVIAFFGFFFIVLPCFLAWLVYRDAVDNDIDIPYVWAIITLFIPVVGLVLYFVFVKSANKYPETKSQPNSKDQSREKETKQGAGNLVERY